MMFGVLALTVHPSLAYSQLVPFVHAPERASRENENYIPPKINNIHKRTPNLLASPMVVSNRVRNSWPAKRPSAKNGGPFRI